MGTIWMATEALLSDDLITLIVKDSFENANNYREVSPRNSPKWPLLRRMRLTSDDIRKFLDWLRADEGGRENPLLPSLKELVLIDCILYEGQTLSLCDALMKRVEQGVPLEMLDLRTCHSYWDCTEAVRLLNEIVVNVLGPEETVDARSQIISMWDGLTRGTFVRRENPDYKDSDTSSDDEDDDYED